MTVRTYTVGELISKLQNYNHNAKVTLVDADTMWTIPKFHVAADGQDVTIEPCEYNEMEH